MVEQIALLITRLCLFPARFGTYLRTKKCLCAANGVERRQLSEHSCALGVAVLALSLKQIAERHVAVAHAELHRELLPCSVLDLQRQFVGTIINVRCLGVTHLVGLVDATTLLAHYLQSFTKITRSSKQSEC